MKRLHQFLLASALLAPVVLNAAAFEGHVTFQMTGPNGQPMEVNQSIKGDKIRIEMQMPANRGGMGGTVATIMDTSKREMTTIMDAQKMYMVMALPEPSANAQKEQSGDAPTLEKTGEKEKILGYTAEKYISTYRGTKTDLWLAEGIGTYMSANTRGSMFGRGRGNGEATAQAWERVLAGKELFPLRVVGHDKDGKDTFRMEVKSIEKKKLSDDLFAPPADYQKMDMGNMMRGMMPGGGRPGGN